MLLNGHDPGQGIGPVRLAEKVGFNFKTAPGRPQERKRRHDQPGNQEAIDQEFQVKRLAPNLRTH